MSNNQPANGFKARHLFLFLAVLALAVAAILLSRRDVSPIAEKPVPVVANPEALDAKLNALQLNVSIEDFHQALGQPTLVREKIVYFTSMQIRRHATPKEVTEELTYREHFYDREHYVVQAVTDESGKVAMYSITARHAGYIPKIQSALGGDIHLGKSVFDALPRKSRKIAGLFLQDPQKTRYYEIVSARAGDVRYAIFSSAPNGYRQGVGRLDGGEAGSLVMSFGPERAEFPFNEQHREFRKATAINTYTVITDWFKGVEMRQEGTNFGETLINFGPDIEVP